ncbi:MAG: hypothetical protein MI861_27715 [Pirellulales bacterium]|nr:hypothetical protein [Pirellulales bacterium]
MWLRNKYFRGFLGASAVAILLIAFAPERSVADGSDDGQPPSAPTPPTPTAGYRAAPAAVPSNYAQTPALPVQPVQPAQPAQVALVSPPPAAAPNTYVPPQPPQYANPYCEAPDGCIRPVGSLVSAIAPAQALPRPIHQGLPEGTWTNDTPLGKVHMKVTGTRIAIDVEGAGELAAFNPALRGEYSVASDGTIFGLIHSVDPGISNATAQSMDGEALLLSGLSDVPFSMRVYAEDEVLAVKQITFGIPMQLMMMTDGETGELSLYAQAMLAGHYHLSK